MMKEGKGDKVNNVKHQPEIFLEQWIVHVQLKYLQMFWKNYLKSI